MHLYFHVPFCLRRCSYCDFAIAVRRRVPSDAYAEAVLREWSARRDDPAWAESRVVGTIYFGGGTPSLLDPSALGRILERVARDRPVAPGAEVTLEANPEDVTPDRVRAWGALGVNRLSLGSQSFDPAVLAWMHRTHGAGQIVRAVETAREGGIAELSLDLIFALPGELGRDWSADLDRALALRPEHLSLYGLTIEEHTPLARWVERGRAVPADEERYAREYLEAHRALRAAGYEHYEVSNAGLPGHRARHNGAYWRRAPYLGLGPSAHSGCGARRGWNLREWVAYERAALAGESVRAGEEVLDDAAVALEELYLGLRTSNGLPADRVPAGVLGSWIREGWATVTGPAPGGTRPARSTGGPEPRVSLTAEGWLRLDALVAALGGAAVA